MKLSIVLLVLCCAQVTLAEISMSNLLAFWEATYDTNKDGIATL